MSFIAFSDVRKSYRAGQLEVHALSSVSFAVEKGELAIVVGPSGAGKTTVLNILGGMDACSAGHIKVDDAEISSFTPKQLTAYRRSDIGFVFQFYNLVPNLTALENVELASQICANPLDAAQILEEVGLGDKVNSFPSQLSGGEQQRVAIARALSKNPKLLLCDEPTGALDDVTGKRILALLQRTSRERGMTVIIITHNHAIIPMADRVIRMKNGRAESVTQNADPIPVERIEW